MKNWLVLISLLVGAIVGNAQPPPSASHDFAISPEGGFFSEKVEVSIDAPESSKVYYTTNGRIPSTRQKPYSRPFLVSKTSVVRVLTVFPDKKRRYQAFTYFIDEPVSTIPVLSLSLPPDILFDPDYGLYVEGPKSTQKKQFGDGSNYWSTREIPAHFEFYETNGREVFNGLIGMRIFGGISRTFPQKSFALVARKKYGHKWIKHKVFGKKGLAKFKYLVLRNSGSDWGHAQLRDGFMTQLVEDWNITKQDYRPAHLYINGAYWGLYNIREKVNRTFVAQHFDVDKNKIDLIEHKITVKKGSSAQYRKLLKFLERNDLSSNDVFAQVETMMDVDNFMDFQIAEIYFNNIDAGGNIKFWREQTPAAKWRWILYDTDWGYALNHRKDYRKNSIDLFTKDNGTEWPLPDWSTFILRKLLTNKVFEHRFVNRFMDRLNTSLQPSVATKLLDEMVETIKPEMPRQQKRWHLSNKHWTREITKMKRFAEKRPGYIIKHLKYKFGLDDVVKINIQSGEGGKVVVNDVINVKDNYVGSYFTKVPVSIKVVAKKGYQFVGWEGLETKEEQLVRFPDKLPTRLKANFEPFIHPLSDQLVINELSTNNFQSGDWIELLNISENNIELGGMLLRDKKHEFRLPERILAPDEFVVVCEDTASFRKIHPNLNVTLVGNLGFGLDKRKETVSLFSSQYAVIDEVAYKVDATDEFQTLALLVPKLDNSRFENWEILPGTGTPGSMNPYYILSKIQATQAYYSKIGLIVGALLLMLLVLYVRHYDGRVSASVAKYLGPILGKINKNFSPKS